MVAMIAVALVYLDLVSRAIRVVLYDKEKLDSVQIIIQRVIVLSILSSTIVGIICVVTGSSLLEIMVLWMMSIIVYRWYPKLMIGDKKSRKELEDESIG